MLSSTQVTKIRRGSSAARVGATLIVGLICLSGADRLCAADRTTFVGVALDQETREADRRLRNYLERSAAMSFAPEELEYRQVIERLVGWDTADGVVVARTTPYVQVVAEMLGAELEILATYVSQATARTTYHSYFVARRDDLPANPTPADVISFVSESPDLIHFTFHSLFSTSSFFLPSLHFRMNRVFHMPEPTESLAAIALDPSESNSSGDLVRAVASGDADLAAVWDGTKARFSDDDPIGREVVFVQLPSTIPNDLLVCSRSAPAELKEKIRTAVREMSDDEISIGDFTRWVDITDASDARAALAHLRWLAREQTTPVTVDVRQGRGSSSGTAAMARAARHAVRLSGTELVLFDGDFYEHIDTVWTLDEIHDGAARLTSSIPGTGIEDQVFPISFRDVDDLTGRIVDIVQRRIHRIRYVWPYSGDQPIVIRDTTLTMPTGQKVPVQRITWIDPDRNRFRAGPIFEVGVRTSNPFIHELEADDFRRAGDVPADLDPMSNISYRVYQLRILPPNTWFRIATGALIALLALAAVAAAIAVRRSTAEDLADQETLLT